MKIAYICSDAEVQLLGHHGCSVHIREFTNALVDAGHDVFIICNWLGDSDENLPKARVYQMKPSGKNKAAWDSLVDDPVIQNHALDRDVGSILWNTWLQVEGAAILEREKPDFIYERYALFGFGGLEMRERLGVPLVLELNAPLCDQQEGYGKFPLINTARHLEPEIIRGADAIVALTQWLADWAIRLGADEERIHVLPDAVSHALFVREISGQDVREQYDLGDNQVVGFTGSFHKWHDVAGLIDVFADLLAADSGRRLLLVGDGHDRKKLEKQVGRLGLWEAVVFTGKVPHEAVPSHLAAIDVSVVPYRPIEEFFFSPMKLFESMAMGCATVAADLGQISEVVRHGETGWLYPPGENGKLCEAIATLLDDRDLASRMGAASRQYVLEHHTWERVTSEVVQIAKGLRSG